MSYYSLVVLFYLLYIVLHALLIVPAVLIAVQLLQPRDKRNARWLVGCCILFVPLASLRIYIYHWYDWRESYYTWKYERACRRHATELLPPEPLVARGVALDVSESPSGMHDGCSGRCSMVAEPLYYLGKHGGAKFDFV